MRFGVEESSSECVAGFEPAWKVYMSGIVRIKTAGSDGAQERRGFRKLKEVVRTRRVFNGRSNDCSELGVGLFGSSSLGRAGEGGVEFWECRGGASRARVKWHWADLQRTS